MAIRDRNNRVLRYITPEGCMKRCTQEKSFVCRSFDYTDSRNCNLSSAKRGDRGVRMVQGSSMIYYERQTGTFNNNTASSTTASSSVPPNTFTIQPKWAIIGKNDKDVKNVNSA
jgi:hypothetical protein